MLLTNGNNLFIYLGTFDLKVRITHCCCGFALAVLCIVTHNKVKTILFEQIKLNWLSFDSHSDSATKAIQFVRRKKTYQRCRAH